MPTSKTEKQIRHLRTRSGILVPLIEDFMRKPVNIESTADVDFIRKLTVKMQIREFNRSIGDKSVYSPSALASCLRHVYLLRHAQGLGIERKPQPRMEANFYFLKGNF